MSDKTIALMLKTQQTLGKHVKKPQLTEKLLIKPPFRFLHDIVKSVIKEKHFLEGLYTPDELQYEKIKDKESKMAFLQKLIDVLEICTGKKVSARPSKIVAGLEAEKTNEMLQLLAQILDEGLSSEEAVKQVLGKGSGKEKKPAEVKKVKEPVKKIPEVKSKAAVERVPPKKKAPAEKKQSEPKLEAKPAPKRERPPLKSVPSVQESESKEESNSSAEKVQVAEEKVPEKPEEPKLDSIPPESNEKLEEPEPTIDSLPPVSEPPERPQSDPKSEPKTPETPPPRPPSSKSDPPKLVDPKPPSAHIRRDKSADKNGKLLRPPTVRPPSARPGAPRRKNKVTEIVLPPDEPVHMGNVSVRLESLDVDLEDDNLVIVDSSAPGEESAADVKMADLEDGDGHLVRQIIESQKNFSKTLGESNKTEAGGGETMATGSVFNKQVNNIKNSLQQLTKAVNPFGKFMDFLQEDLDAMQIELGAWREKSAQLEEVLMKQKELSESSNTPIKQKIVELEDELKDHRILLETVKQNIYQNDKKLLNMGYN